MNKLKNDNKLSATSIETEDATYVDFLPPDGLKISRYVQAYLTQQKRLLIPSQKVTNTTKKSNTLYTASYDLLTGLPNWEFTTKLLEKSIQLAKKNNEVLSIFYLNICDFKQVNNIYGHTLSNQVLVVIAKRLRKLARCGHLLSRLGGDEFLIYLTVNNNELSLVDELKIVISKAINQPISIEGLIIDIVIEIDIEVVAYPIHGVNIDVLLDIANKKMYKTRQKKNS